MPLEATLKEKSCAICGTTFKPVSARQKYCSKPCKMGSKTCESCGVEFVRKAGTAGRFCSPACWYRVYHDSTRVACLICGKEFHRQKERQKTCSVECANAIRRTAKRNTHCASCGTPLRADCHPKVRFCSKSCGMKDRDRNGQLHAPEGTKKTTPLGYVLIKSGKSWVSEHRHIMSEVIGRPLTRADHVHHMNGNRADNRPENLELWSGRKDPSGQRQTDLIEEAMRQSEIAGLSDEQQRGVREAMLRTIFKL